MLKRGLDIFYKTMASKAFWAAMFLCLTISGFVTKTAEASIGGSLKEAYIRECQTTGRHCDLAGLAAKASGSNVINGYECPTMDVLLERYQGDCFPCQIVNVLLSSFMRAAGNVYDVSKDAGNKLLFLGTFLWLAFWGLRKMSSLTNVEPASMMNELVVFLGKILVAYCFINAGIGTLVSYAINPVIGAGAEFGSALLVESENMDLKEPPKSENAYSGPTEIVSKNVMDKILRLSEGVSNEVAMNLVIGNALTCFSIQQGFTWNFIVKFRIPDIWLWLCGAAIWCAGFMLVLSVCYYLVDIPFKLGFAIIALPVVIGLWPFGMTSGKFKSVVMIAINAAGTFLFLALSASYAIRLINNAFNAVGGLPDKTGNALSGVPALLYAFQTDNVKYVESAFEITGPAFLIILFCYIYAIKMISHITDTYPNKFFGGSMTGGASPLHHMATAATMWATKKAAAPFKKAMDVAAHQAGKAATTVAKAGINVSAGLAGNLAGRGVKAIGKGVNKFGQKMAAKAGENKEAWDALAQQDQLNKSSLQAKIGNKLGKLQAGLQMGLANTVAKTGELMENGGEMMKAPGARTFNRIANAGKDGLETLGNTLGELAGQLPSDLGEKLQENAQAIQNGKNSGGGNKAKSMVNRAIGKVLGTVGNTIVNNQAQNEDIQTHADEKLGKALENFGESSRTLAKYIPARVGVLTGALGELATAHAETSQNKVGAFLSRKLGSALIKTGNVVVDNRPEANTIRHKLYTLNVEKLKTVFSGKAIVAKVAMKLGDFADEVSVNYKADHKIYKENKKRFVHNISNLKEINEERKLENRAVLGVDIEGFKEYTKEKGWEHVKADYEAMSKDREENPIGLGRTIAEGVTTPFVQGYQHGKEGLSQSFQDIEINNLYDVGGAVIRPAFAIGYALKETGKDTLESSYQVAEKTMLSGIDLGQRMTLWMKTPAKASVYGAYAIGDRAKIALTPVMTGVGTLLDGIETAGSYTRMVTRPVMMTLGAVAFAPVSFAAKAVDETLYAGYKMTVRPAIEIGTAIGRGANVLYRGAVAGAVSTKAGRGVVRTFKVGSKTLKLGVETLKLGRNLIKAAAGEGGYDNHILTEEERAKKREERQQRNKDEKAKRQKERREEEKRRREEERAEEQREREQRANERREERERQEEEREQRRAEREQRRAEEERERWIEEHRQDE